MYTVGATILYDDISVVGLSTGGGGGYDLTITMPNGCPGPITVGWTGAGPGQFGIVVGNNLGSTTIPANNPCPGTVLGIQGSVMLVDPPGFLNTQGGAGSVNSNVNNAGVCGKRLQLVKGVQCIKSNVAQIN
jgi:hypothetical protein